MSEFEKQVLRTLGGIEAEAEEATRNTAKIAEALEKLVAQGEQRDSVIDWLVQIYDRIGNLE